MQLASNIGIHASQSLPPDAIPHPLNQTRPIKLAGQVDTVD